MKSAMPSKTYTNCTMILMVMLLLMGSCDRKSHTSRRNAKDDVLLAEVGDRLLYLSDIKNISSKGISGADSIAVLNGYIEQWVRRMSMLEKAEQSVSENIDIDALMEEYRSSLVLHNYRQELIKTQLDTSITADQLMAYYTTNKSQFVLAEPLVRGEIIAFDAKQKGLDQFYSKWKKGKDVASFISENAKFTMQDTSHYMLKDEFLMYLVGNKMKQSSLKDNTYYQYNNDGKEYFVRLIDYVADKEDPPLRYVSSKMKKVILNKRKNDLIKNIENKIYNTALNNNRIKVHTR